MTSTPASIVAVCDGKSCRNRSETTALMRSLDGSIPIVRLKCIGACAGPVVAIKPANGTPVVLTKVRSAKERRDVLRVVAGGSVSNRLQRRLAGSKAQAKAQRRIA
ncbi:MAG: hypothetical protein R2710_08190 [Acidimicrobiales bacterium]